jgi:translation elongation factor EF-1beta
MAKAIITFKLMPESPEVDLVKVEQEGLKIAKDNGAIGEMVSEVKELGFGIKYVIIKGMYEVEGSDFEKISGQLETIKGVQNANIENMDLALG